MKQIIVEVVEGGHRYHSLIEFLRRDNYIFTTQQKCEQTPVSGSYPVEECIEAAQRYADGKMMDGYPAEYEQVMIDAHNAGQLFLRNKFNIELDYGV